MPLPFSVASLLLKTEPKCYSISGRKSASLVVYAIAQHMTFVAADVLQQLMSFIETVPKNPEHISNLLTTAGSLNRKSKASKSLV